MTRRRTSRLPLLESLEPRQFLSATHLSPKQTTARTATTQYHLVTPKTTKATKSTKPAKTTKTTKATPHATYASPVGKTPSQIRKAYGVDSILFGSITGDGAGQTIAIVDAYDDPSLVSSTNANFSISDLARFDDQFNLADPPSFTKVSQTGSKTSLPAFDSGWSGEISLDVEWAHAMAPKASILLVEASNSSFTNLNAAVSYAKKQAGVSVVSMSYGTTEFSGETSSDSIYTTPTGHTGVSFFASTGDAGSPGSYQAYSPNVVAVGGTSLYLADSSGTYSSESGWSGGGGGISSYESQPSYQKGVVTQTSTRRATPDVSALADPNTGVAILDTADTGIGSSGGWEQIGGTSLAAPLWAGMMAVADQGRALLGLSPLDGKSQTLPRLYSLNSSDFHDVTTGSNGGFSASAGYDLVTGRGTPKANLLIPDLAGGATIAGTVFNDTNGNGTRDSGESPLANTALYLDLNNNGTKDSSEPTATTSATGAYSFTDLLGRVSYSVREVTPSGYLSTTPTSLTLSSLYGTTTTGDFGLTTPPQTSFTGQTLTLRLDPTATELQVFTTPDTTGTPTYSIPKSLASTLTFTGTTANDLLTLDLTNGNPLAAFSISYDGGTGSDTVAVRGTAAADTAVFSNTAITVDGATLSTTNTESSSFDGARGYDSVTNTGTNPLTLAANQQVQSLTLSANSTATLTPGRNTLYTHTLSIASNASLDLTDGTLIVDDPAAAVSTVRSYLTTGYNAGLWTGTGLRSSTAAAADSQKETALGYLTAADLGASTYNGNAVSPTAVIVRYTYYGDATLNGKVDSDDVAMTDRGRAKNLTGWLYGDFNYDGATTPADYSLQGQPFQSSAPPIV